MGRWSTTEAGQRFGAWTTVEVVEKRARPRGGHHIYWLCECECGVRAAISRSNLKATMECTGHPQLDLDARRAERARRAGEIAQARRAAAAKRVVQEQARVARRVEREARADLRKKRAYRSWREMTHRCAMPNHKDYPNYGGRGIAVCDRWKSFANFLADMGERPEGMTLDRKDNALNYTPDNCRWATATEQNRNSRHCKLTAADVIEIRGQLLQGARFRTLGAQYGVTPENIRAINLRRSWRDVP